MNGHLGRPREDVIGLNGNAAITSATVRVPCGARSKEAARHALTAGLVNGGVCKRFSTDATVESSLIGPPKWSLDKVSTRKKYWGLTLPASVKGKLGELKGSTTAVLKLESRQGLPPPVRQ